MRKRREKAWEKAASVEKESRRKRLSARS